MADYRYHFYDTSTGSYLDTLPMEGVSFSVELRGVGTLTGEIPLGASDLDAARVRDATIPDRTKVFVERDNALVWGGRLVAPRDYDSGTGRLRLNAEETLGALASRFLPTVSYINEEQINIAQAIIALMQDEPGGQLDLNTGPGWSNVYRDRNYQASDRTGALQAITDLSEVINGFEFATQVTWGDDGNPYELVLFGYPLLGRRGSESGLVLDYDQFTAGTGNVASYTWSDGPGLFTRSFATSETDESVQLVASATNGTLLAAGFPLLEQTQSYDGVTNMDTLQAHADALSAYASGHHVTAAFTVRAQPGTELGDWQLGDDVLVRISDWRFPPNAATGAPGFSGYLRMVAFQVDPGVEGAEVYTFTMADFLEAL